MENNNNKVTFLWEREAGKQREQKAHKWADKNDQKAELGAEKRLWINIFCWILKLVMMVPDSLGLKTRICHAKPGR